MEKAIKIAMSLVIIATVAIGASALSELNDGRVLVVVKQLTSNQSAQAAK
jgi:hypothetical protein